jgi:hypothetical protein
LSGTVDSIESSVKNVKGDDSAGLQDVKPERKEECSNDELGIEDETLCRLPVEMMGTWRMVGGFHAAVAGRCLPNRGLRSNPVRIT